MSSPTFNKTHSLSIRLWHWLFFLLILGAITTVTLSKFLFNTGQNISLVQNELIQKGITIDNNTARSVSHAFNDKLWHLHTWIGYGIAFLVLSRLIIELTLGKDEKTGINIKKAIKFIPATAEEREEKNKFLLIKWVYVLFYALMVVMALTGLGLAFEDVPFFHASRHQIKSVHSFIQYPIYAFIIVHLIGVVRADLKKYPGIISSMINGKPSS